MGDTRPIGVYDSGVGGLSVLRHLHARMPGERIIYFADTARAPYGARSTDEILRFARQIVSFLSARRVKLVVVACNTSSALALPTIRHEFAIPLLGMIDAGVQAAVAATRHGRIGLLATEGTVRSGAYRQRLAAEGSQYALAAQAAPRLVPLIESGRTHGRAVQDALHEYLTPLRQFEVDTLILGCTHYPFVREEIERIVGPKVRVIDPAEGVAIQARAILQSERKLSVRRRAITHFYTSGDPKAFKRLGRILLQKELSQIRYADMDALYALEADA